ncbi:VaFE repeat-containing surface-anchored protein, partial [Corynebacterium diphtheriae]
MPKEHEVLISKVDLGGTGVVGAKLRILKGDAESSKKPEVAMDLQDNTPAEWVTEADDAHTVKLAAGKYKLEETFAPAPLKVITTFEFEVDYRGVVTLGEVKTAGERDGEAVLEARVQGDDNNVITVVDGQVTLNTNAYDADAPRWDNTLESTGGTIADAIRYEGLVPGKQYRVKGELMDKT